MSIDGEADIPDIEELDNGFYSDDSDDRIDDAEGGSDDVIDSQIDSEKSNLLRTAWVNETCSPELLMFERDTIDTTINYLERMQSVVDEYRSKGVDQSFTANIYQMELDRIRFSLSKYLRTRLQKIDRDAFYILVVASDLMVEGRLSEREFEYAKERCDLIFNHLKATVLDDLPQKLGTIDTDVGFGKMISEPNLDVFVVARATKDVGLVDVSDDGEIQLDFKNGDEYMYEDGLAWNYIC